MGFLIILLLISIGLIWTAGKTANGIMKVGRYLQEKADQNRLIKERMLHTMDAVEDIRAHNLPKITETNPLDNLLQANKEIAERNKLKDAVKNELGVDL